MYDVVDVDAIDGVCGLFTFTGVDAISGVCGLFTKTAGVGECGTSTGVDPVDFAGPKISISSEDIGLKLSGVEAVVLDVGVPNLFGVHGLVLCTRLGTGVGDDGYGLGGNDLFIAVLGGVLGEFEHSTSFTSTTIEGLLLHMTTSAAMPSMTASVTSLPASTI